MFTVYRRNIFIGMMIHVLQQTTGCNIIGYYGPAIMNDTGFGGQKPADVLYSMVFLGFIYITANFIYVIASNKYGRR